MMFNSPMRLSRIHFSLVIFMVTFLTACESHDFSELHGYIASIKIDHPAVTIEPVVPDFKIVEPFIFKPTENLRDPFKLVEKIKVAPEKNEPDNGIRPDTNRVREPLEAFEISGMKMVGTVNMKSVLWGLIKNDGIVYRVKVGNHLGKNDGKIIFIDKDKIDTIEIMPNKPGRFIEQPTTLTLTE